MVNLKISAEELHELTKGVRTWDELKAIYIKVGIITPAEIDIDEKFSRISNIIFQKRERGEITELEYNRMMIELDHEQTRAYSELYDKEHGEPAEKCEIDYWIEELDKIIAARDANKISTEEYWRLCFELDKKYFYADEDDAKIYLGEENEYKTYNQNNSIGEIAVHF